MGRLIVGGMLLMALLSLMVGLKTVPSRRARDPRQPLGYLPPDINIVGELRVADLIEEPAGREFVEKARLGTFRVADLELWAGLSRYDVETMLLGVQAADRMLPQVILIVQTRQAYEPAKILSHLADPQLIHRRDKDLYRFSGGSRPVGGVVWLAAERFLVFGLTAEDLDGVPEQPRPGIDHLSPELQRVLEERGQPGSQVWIAGADPHWERTMLGGLLVHWLGAGSGLLQAVENWGAWLTFADTVSVQSVCRFKDEKAAATFQSALQQRLANAGSSQVEPNHWVTWKSRLSLAELLQQLENAGNGLGLPGAG